MPGILVIVFWCWCAISVGVLVRRAFRRAAGRPTRTASAADVRSRPPWPPLHEIDPQPAVAAPPDTPAAGTATPASTVTATVGAPAEDAAPAVDTRPRPATLADALRGIQMPCELAPLTGTSADFETRAAFFTVGYPAEVVAPEVADELERIGMTFNSTTDTTAVAERDGKRVLVAVRSVGVAVQGVTDLVYPTAPEHSVIVEFELD